MSLGRDISEMKPAAARSAVTSSTARAWREETRAGFMDARKGAPPRRAVAIRPVPSLAPSRARRAASCPGPSPENWPFPPSPRRRGAAAAVRPRGRASGRRSLPGRLFLRRGLGLRGLLDGDGRPSGSSSWPLTTHLLAIAHARHDLRLLGGDEPHDHAAAMRLPSAPITKTVVLFSSRTMAAAGTMSALASAPPRSRSRRACPRGAPRHRDADGGGAGGRIHGRSRAHDLPRDLPSFAPGMVTRALCPTATRVASATGTAAVTCRRRRSTTRRTCSFASMTSPGLCQRSATIPLKGAMGVARAARSTAAAWVCPDSRTADSASSSSLRASSTSLRDAIPFSSSEASRS